MRRTGFEAFVLGLRGTELVRQWRDDSVAKIGGKVFALLDRDPGEVWLKVSDMAYDLLTELPGIRPAPYFARAGWVAVSARLTRRLRAELGLDALIAAAPRRP